MFPSRQFWEFYLMWFRAGKMIPELDPDADTDLSLSVKELADK